MPEALKFGKLPPKIDSRTIRLSSIIREELLPELPPTWDCHEIRDTEGNILFTIQDNFVFRNAGKDALGNCVKAARAHQTLVFEGFEQGKQIEITDQEVVDEYFEETGGRDSGLILLLSLNDWRNNGWLVGGKIYTIYAFASVDWKNHDEARHCIHLLGGVNFGMKVYQKDVDQFNADEPWHLTGDDGDLRGRHGVYLHNYIANQGGITCTTWGRQQPMTWDFWDNRIDEAYGIVDNRNAWQGDDSALDVQKLDAYLNKITGNGGVPQGCSFPPFTIARKILYGG